MDSSFEYYDLFASNKLDGTPISQPQTIMQKSSNLLAQPSHTVETLVDFTPDVKADLKMTDNIQSTHLNLTKNEMRTDANMDYSNKVSDPYGYGYIPSLSEVRNNDANEIRNQESVIFSLGTIAGVSLIVLGILVTSSSSSTA
jgi:hypothetical protein